MKEINCNPMPRLTAFISGMVQKTGYRARVVILAKCLRAAGIRADLPSGMVKVVAEGEQTDLGSVPQFLNIKDALIEVQSIEKEYTAATGEFTGLGCQGGDQGVHEAVQDVRQEVNNTGEMLAEKIDDAKVEIANEVKELRSGLRDDLKERLIRIEADISQMKARNSL